MKVYAVTSCPDMTNFRDLIDEPNDVLAAVEGVFGKIERAKQYVVDELIEHHRESDDEEIQTWLATLEIEWEEVSSTEIQFLDPHGYLCYRITTHQVR